MRTSRDTMSCVSSTLLRWSWVVLFACLLSGGVAWIYQSKNPRQFQAESALLYRFGREYFPIVPGEQRRSWAENVSVSLEAAILTEIRFLNSQKLFEQTLLKIDTSDLLETAPGVPGTVADFSSAQSGAAKDGKLPNEYMHLGIVRDIAEKFEIKRYKSSAVVLVTARHPVPEVADMLVKTHIDTYLAWRNELFNQDASNYFESQVSRTEDEHEALVIARNQLEQEFGIYDPDIESELARRQIADAESKLDDRPGDTALRQSALEARADLDRINLFRTMTEPLNSRIRVVLDKLTDLEVEETNWRLTRDFDETVVPVVALIDERTATNNAIGQSPKLIIAAASLAGTVLSALIIVGLALIAHRSMSTEIPPPGSATNDSTDTPPKSGASKLFQLASTSDAG